MHQWSNSSSSFRRCTFFFRFAAMMTTGCWHFGFSCQYRTNAFQPLHWIFVWFGHRSSFWVSTQPSCQTTSQFKCRQFITKHLDEDKEEEDKTMSHMIPPPHTHKQQQVNLTCIKSTKISILGSNAGAMFESFPLAIFISYGHTLFKTRKACNNNLRWGWLRLHDRINP